MVVQAQMEYVRTLEDGSKLYYADDTFERPGYVIWNGTENVHVGNLPPRVGNHGPQGKKRPFRMVTPRRRKR